MNYVLVIECPLLVIFALEIVQVGEDDQPWCLNVQQYAADVPNCKHCSLVNVGMCEICEMEDEANDLMPQGKVDM